NSPFCELAPVGRHREGRGPVEGKLLADGKVSELLRGFPKVGSEPFVAIGEAWASAGERAVAQQVGEELDAGLSQRPLTEHVDAPRDGDARAGVDLAERPPPVDGEKWVTERRAHRASETRRDLEGGLVAVVDEGGRFGRSELPVIGQGEQS